MDIAMIGTGYVGLVSGTCFSESGNNVICVDIDERKIEQLNNGISPIYEPGLDELIHRNRKENRLHFTTNLVEAVKSSLIIFIAVGTPMGEDGSADLGYVLAAAREIGKNIDSFKIIVVKSTVPVGSCERVRNAVQQELDARNARIEFDVVSNPEFLKEGAAIEDFMKPDRVVIGVDNVRTAEIMKELYSPFVRTGKPILVMDNRSSEMTKYVANAMLATRISFMNEMANLCDRLGVDIDLVRQGVGSDSRIGYPFLFPGIGYGGSCFPKDVKALVRMGTEAEYEMRILEAVEAVNHDQKTVLIPRIMNHFENDLKGKHFAVWGLSFKPKTDDMREAPSVEIINALLKNGARVTAFDPVAAGHAKSILKDRIQYAATNYDSLDNADALIIATEWDEFRRPDWNRMIKLMKKPVIFDGRNIFDPKRMKEYGFVYYGIGRSGSAR